ncbi:MAG: GHKL domain-containing protein, partial [Streptococcaceae bacterium]|nr:GHKL domain-containing protein [Streptococcaceae bacterium]
MILNILIALLVYVLTALSNSHSLISSIFLGTCLNTVINGIELAVLPVIYVIAPNHQIDIENTYIAFWLYGLTYILKILAIFILKKGFFTEVEELSTEVAWNTKIMGLVFVIFSSLPFVVLGLDVYRLKSFGTRDIIIIIAYVFLNIVLLYYLKKIFRYFQNYQRLALEKAIIESEIAKFKRRSELDEEVKIFHHDLRNHFLTINSLLKDKKYEEIQKYIDNQMNPSNYQVEESYSENAVLNYFLVEKKKIADSLGILFTIDTKLPVDVELPLEVFSVILGNALDNAINASKRLPVGKEKKIDVKVNAIMGGNLIIIISNKFDRREIITRKRRKQKEGIGRKSIHKYVTHMK